MEKLSKEGLVYPELSYLILGVCFNVFNELGPGFHEKVYQRAMVEEFVRSGFQIKQQMPVKIYFKEKVVGRSFLDFLIEDKIVVEIKKDNKFSKSHINQVVRYLKETNLKLGILVNFTNRGIVSKRILNLY